MKSPSVSPPLRPVITPAILSAISHELAARGWRGSPADAARALGLRPVPMSAPRMIDGGRS